MMASNCLYSIPVWTVPRSQHLKRKQSVTKIHIVANTLSMWMKVETTAYKVLTITTLYLCWPFVYFIKGITVKLLFPPWKNLIAYLVARPIGLGFLKPEQEN